MYIVLKGGKLKGILSLGFKKAGNIRKLAIQVKIPKSTLSYYHMEKRKIKKENLDKLADYLNIFISKEDIVEELPDNWKQIKGGKKCVELKKKNGSYEKQLKECHNKSSIFMKRLHKKMKKENPAKYYLSQYSRFKKIGGYKFVTNNGEKVRNNLEKETADILKKINFDYKYEPLVKIKNKYFFPDFLVNNKFLIECTEWRGYDKAIKLKKKIRYLSKKYKVYVVIPKALNRYYETLNHNLVFEDNLFEFLKMCPDSSIGRAHDC